MICPNCGQETDPEKLCTSCGAPLPEDESRAVDPNTADVQMQASVTAGNAESEQFVNAAQNTGEVQREDVQNHTSELASTQENTQDQTQESAKPNEFVETLKRESSHFGHFFWDMLKGPDEAKKTNHTSMTPAIITMVIFSILIALGSYLIANQIVSIWGGVSFVDSFLIPFIQFIILFAVVIALVFGGAKMAAQSLSFTDVIAKVGAYTVPFLVLTIVGSLLTLIGLSVAGVLVILGLLGPILIIPTLILLEQPANGFDRIYVLIGIYVVSLLISGMLVQSILSTFLGGITDSIMGGFGF